MAVMHLARNGNADRARAGWPSAVLHGVGAAMDRGLDRRRLAALADFIEGLEMMPEWGGEAPGPLGDARFVDGQIECLGFVLRAGGAGYGTVLFHGDRQSDSPKGYYLSGYGLVCWGWGTTVGMNAVADTGYVNKVQAVLTAEPVRNGEVPGFRLHEVTTAHVADAIRQFIESEEPGSAWYMAAGMKREIPNPIEPAGPAPATVEASATEEPAPADSGLTSNEQWKALLIDERFDELRALCEGRIRDFDTRIRESETARALWRRRLAAVNALEGDGDEPEGR